MIAGNLLQQAYNLADTWMVGHFIRADGLAAVGSAFSLMTFLTSVLLGLCMGCGVIFSQAHGSEDQKRFRAAIQSSFVLVIAVSILLTILAGVFLPFLIFMMKIPDSLIPMIHDYLVWILPGIPFIGIYNFFASCLRSSEDSLSPLIVLVISALVNIGLDYLLIVIIPLSAAGAAIASLTAQILAAVLCTITALKKHAEIRDSLFMGKWSFFMMRPIFGCSSITCLQQSVMNLGILMVQGLVNSFGTGIMAAFAAGVKIDSLAYMPLQEFGNAFSIFTAQNYGAGKKERIKKGLQISVLMSAVYAGLISALFWLYSENLVQIFIDPELYSITADAVHYLHIEGSFYFAIGILFLFYGYFRALGHPWISVILTAISLGTRVGLSYCLSGMIGVDGIWYSIVIGWLLADLAGVLFLRKLPGCQEENSFQLD